METIWERAGVKVVVQRSLVERSMITTWAMVCLVPVGSFGGRLLLSWVGIALSRLGRPDRNWQRLLIASGLLLCVQEAAASRAVERL